MVLRKTLQPIDALKLKEQANLHSTASNTIVVSSFISHYTRTKLKEVGIYYLDLTGNIWLQLNNPAVYIETMGAQTNPNTIERPARTLKGAKAGLIVRELIDAKKVFGIRELALRTKINPGYISRLFTLLEEQAIIRAKQNSTQIVDTTSLKRNEWDVDWAALLRRWAQDAPLAKRARISTYIEPRGLKATLALLSKSSIKYAITGSYAASEIAPIAPPRLLHIYVENAFEASKELGLRETESGANIVLIEPQTDAPFLHTQQRNQHYFAAISQIAADLLSSPGRAPAEAEELINWMKNNEETWRG